MATTRLKQDDTGPRTWTLSSTDANDDLTTASSVVVNMEPWDDTTNKITDGSATIDSSTATTLTVSYDFQAADTDTAGVFKLEFEVTFASGDVKRFPSDGYHRVEIDRAL